MGKPRPTLRTDAGAVRDPARVHHPDGAVQQLVARGDVSDAALLEPVGQPRHLMPEAGIPLGIQHRNGLHRDRLILRCGRAPARQRERRDDDGDPTTAMPPPPEPT